MPALDLQPGSAPSSRRLAARRPGPTLRRRIGRVLGRLRVGKRWVDQCFGARAGAWLARANTLGFVLLAFVSSRPLPEARTAVLRLSLVVCSWCAGLAALSLAGPALERGLDAGRGLLEGHGIALGTLRRERPLLLAYWSLRELGVLALLVVGACLATASEGGGVLQLLALGAGSLVYLTALGAGLGALALLCAELGGGRGQSLLALLVLVPELLSPAWPELPTLVRGYGHLLDACIGLGLWR